MNSYAGLVHWMRHRSRPVDTVAVIKKSAQNEIFSKYFLITFFLWIIVLILVYLTLINSLGRELYLFNDEKKKKKKKSATKSATLYSRLKHFNVKTNTFVPLQLYRLS